jgi:D-alanyl-D-alanine dipeptidase
MKAQTLLPKGIQIIFEEGHRPIAVQKKIFNDYYQQVKLKNPNFTDEQLKQECYKYVADPEGTPPHSTGGAIDISLADENGNEIDMGSSSDDTPDNNGDRNYTFSENITAEGKRNRKILIDIMEELDFVNYPTEWWHWSYGDQYWAFVKKTNAIYGTIENPEYPPDLSASYFS